MSAVGTEADMPVRALMSANDPNVWTGRASQEAFSDGEVGLALMYPACLWSFTNRSHNAVAGFAVHGACSSGLIAPAICGQEHGRSIPLADMPADMPAQLAPVL